MTDTKLVHELINGVIVDEFHDKSHSKEWYFAVALEKALVFIANDETDKDQLFKDVHEVFAKAEGIAN